jgi:hypothetical protein
VTDRTVVVSFRFIVSRNWEESRWDKPNSAVFCSSQRRSNYILMFVVWKLDCELLLSGWISKGESRVIAWRDL